VCSRCEIVDENATDAAPHRLWLDEEVIELAPAVVDRQYRRETESPSCRIDGNTHSSEKDYGALIGGAHAAITGRLDALEAELKHAAETES
jgi:hypothetical protein